jgi:hypothetical protein
MEDCSGALRQVSTQLPFYRSRRSLSLVVVMPMESFNLLSRKDKYAWDVRRLGSLVFSVLFLRMRCTDVRSRE